MTTSFSRNSRLAIALLAVVGAGVAAVGLAGDEAKVTFTDVRADTLRFHEYYETITLTPEQQAVMDEALGPIPAPCCSDRSASTCCCQCNLGRSWWGLSKHLITERGFDALEVRAAVQSWFEFVNPEGFSGDSCYAGGCMRSFDDNGCGGMIAGHVVF